MALNIEVISDGICPWCFVGKRRLEKALKAVEGRDKIQVTWRPFQLNPNMPKEGMDRRTYRTAKFGSWEKSQALDAQVAAVGAAEGIPFAFDRIQRTPNTFDSHRLIWLAQREGIQDGVVEALFRSYFTEGLDISDRQILLDIASTVGLPQVDRFLDSDDGVEAVHQEEREVRQRGISGVPFFIINSDRGISGAQPAEALLAAFEQALDLANAGSLSRSL